LQVAGSIFEGVLFKYVGPTIASLVETGNSMKLAHNYKSQPPQEGLAFLNT
jgi:hypothetical protein